MRMLRLLLVVLGFVVFPSLARAAPQNGWWWNPAEPGRGFFIEIQGDLAYIGAYVYATDGRADWVVSQGTMSTPTSYSGRLLSFRGGQTLVGDYKAPGPAADVGPITIQFTDDTHATLTWPGGSVPIERFTFDAGTAEFPPATGWWWNPQESGSGWTIEVQGKSLFLVGFMYDGAGNPVWYYSSGKLTTPTSYSGTLLQFANGQSLTGTYRPPGTPVQVGTITIEFTAPDRAEITVSDGAASLSAVREKRTRSRPIMRTLPPPPLSNLPLRWEGLLSQVLHMVNTGATRVEQTVRLTASAVVWEAVLPEPGKYPQVYKVTSGTAEVRHTMALIDPDSRCDGSGGTTFSLADTNSLVDIRPDATYRGQIKSFSPYGYQVHFTCTGNPPTPPFTIDSLFALDIGPQLDGGLPLFEGNILDMRIRGHPKHILVEPPVTITTTWFWYFVGVGELF